MISKKIFAPDGSNTRFLSDFIIRSEQFTRVYNYVYDVGGVDGDVDVATGLFVRVLDAPKAPDLITIDKWDLVDNSISFYTAPKAGTRVYIEVATTPEEFGTTLIEPSVVRAETAADAAEASEIAAKASEAAAALSEAAAALSETNAAASAAAALASQNAAALSETNASASEVAAGLSEAAAALSEAAAALSETNAASSETAAGLSETNSAASAVAAAASAVAAEASEIAAKASEDAVAADLILTNADVVLTHADAAQTALDRVATGADATATALDKIATNADAAATALDKIATNADVVITNADAVTTNTNATNAQLRAWEAEAEKMTADSYATEAEDVFVNSWASDGDGTFTATPTTDYSALHYSAKAENGLGLNPEVTTLQIGTGTTNPTEKLTINAVAYASNQSGGIALQNSSGTWESGMFLRSDSNGIPRIGLDTSGTEAISLRTGGNVGIGETSPDSILHIKGNAPYIIIGNESEDDAGITFRDEQDHLGQHAYIKYGSLTNKLTIGHDNVGDSIVIDNAGHVTMPDQPIAVMYNPVSATITDGYVVKFNNNGEVAGGMATSLSTGRFTVPVDGRYKVSVQVSTSLVNASAGDGIILRIRKNGAEYLGGAYGLRTYGSTAGMEQTFNADVIMACSGSDYIDFQFTNVSSTATTGNGNANIFLIG